MRRREYLAILVEPRGLARPRIGMQQQAVTGTQRDELLERQQLADSLARYMGQLGLERRTKVYDLNDYVVENYGEEPDG